VRIINDSAKLVVESKNLSTRLSRCDLAIQHLEYMRDTYERRGIWLLDEPSEQKLAKFLEARDECVVEDVQARMEVAKQKAAVASTPASRANAFSPVLLAISTGRKEMRDSSRVESRNVV